MKPSLSCCGVSCCSNASHLSKDTLDARISQEEIGSVYAYTGASLSTLGES